MEGCSSAISLRLLFKKNACGFDETSNLRQCVEVGIMAHSTRKWLPNSDSYVYGTSRATLPLSEPSSPTCGGGQGGAGVRGVSPGQRHGPPLGGRLLRRRVSRRPGGARRGRGRGCRQGGRVMAPGRLPDRKVTFTVSLSREWVGGTPDCAPLSMRRAVTICVSEVRINRCSLLPWITLLNGNRRLQ